MTSVCWVCQLKDSPVVFVHLAMYTTNSFVVIDKREDEPAECEQLHR